MEPMGLGKFVRLMTKDQPYHICIHDLSGLLSFDRFRIDTLNQYHSRDICNAAKSTSKGMQLCLSCKYLTLSKAMENGMPFSGTCPAGVFEAVTPVVLENRVVCVVYVGNLVDPCIDIDRKIHRLSKLTGVEEDLVLKKARRLPPAADTGWAEQLGELIASYITLLYQNTKVKLQPNTHWAVEALKKYVSQYYDKDLKLSRLSRLYYLNETYLGRLFKKQEGTSFTNYLNTIRIDTACRMLEMTNDNILRISMAVGFNNVTYFNRVFKKRMGMTPAEYRRSKDEVPNCLQ